MPRLIRAAGLLVLLLVVSAPAASGATQKEIEASLKRGVDSIKTKYSRAATVGAGDEQGIGVVCLSGLALLEAGVPANDPAVKNITGTVRDFAYVQNRTYHVSLCLMYLDRLGDPADVPLIQALAVRLLAGQNGNGGWGYVCIQAPSADDVKRLQAMKADQAAGQLHPEVKAYAQALAAARAAAGNATGAGGDDNSNTQFALLGVWMARKHGVPVEPALELVEKRFMATQDARSGNWSYNGVALAPGPGGAQPLMGGSPAMYCAGLLGMSTGVARREEKKLKDPPAPKPDAPPKPNTKPDKPTDPFYNPPGGKEPDKKPPARPSSAQDLVIQRAFAGLGVTLVDLTRKGLLHIQNGGHGNGDLYFLWSLERVCVVYGLDKVGGVDWFDVGSTAIVRSQSPDGSWSVGGYGSDINTSFAVLFLSRSNLARDLASKVQKDPTSTEMRAGNGPNANELLPNRPVSTPANPIPVLDLPNPTNDEGVTLASKMLKSTGADWKKLLEEARDAKGASNTKALVLAAANTADDRKKQAREALAERLCRMTPATLRAMLKDDQAEMRRGAALACAMKDDKSHIPDLIELITDPDDSVTRAAKAGLKSLTGKDFGPAADASAGQKALAASAWKEWYDKEKK